MILEDFMSKNSNNVHPSNDDVKIGKIVEKSTKNDVFTVSRKTAYPRRRYGVFLETVWEAFPSATGVDL